MGRVLSSWKEIAKFLGKGVRTVQRWEKELQLPVRRPADGTRHIVLADEQELMAWANGRDAGRPRITTILLCNLEREVQDSFRTSLEDRDYLVLTCRNEDHAWYLFDDGPRIDLLVAGIKVPDNRGLEFAKKVSERRPNLPVILIASSTAVDGAFGEASSHGWTILSRPLRIADFIAAVDKAVGERSSSPPRRERRKVARQNDPVADRRS